MTEKFITSTGLVSLNDEVTYLSRYIRRLENLVGDLRDDILQPQLENVSLGTFGNQYKNIYVSEGGVIGGDVTFSGTVSVEGKQSFTDGFNADGNINLAVNNGDIVVGNSESSTTINGSINLTGTTKLSTTTIVGVTNINASGSNTTNIGNDDSVTNIGGTSNLTSVNIANDVHVTGAVLAGGLSEFQDVIVHGDLTVKGTTNVQNIKQYDYIEIIQNQDSSTDVLKIVQTGTLANLMDITSNISENSIIIDSNMNLNIGNGNVTITTSTGDTTISGELNVSGQSTLGETSINGLTVINDATVNGSLTVTDLTISGDNNVTGDFGVTGKTVLNGQTTVNSDMTINGKSTFNDDLTINANLFINGSVSEITQTSTLIINQTDADGSTPAIQITQGGTDTGPIMIVTDSDTNKIFEINQNCDVVVGTKFSIQNSSGAITTGNATVNGLTVTGGANIGSGLSVDNVIVNNNFTMQYQGGDILDITGSTGVLNLNATSTILGTTNINTTGDGQTNINNLTVGNEINTNGISNTGTIASSSDLIINDGLFKVTGSTGNVDCSDINANNISGTWIGGIIGPAYGGTGVNNGSNTLLLSGNLSLVGNNNVTLTATGSTNVTLPTSGTLITSENVSGNYLALSGGKMSGILDMNGNIIKNVGTLSATSTTINGGNIVLNSSGTFSMTQSGGSALTMTNNGSGGVTINSNTGSLLLESSVNGANGIKLLATTGTDDANIDIISSAGGITLNASKNTTITNNALIGGKLTANNLTTLVDTTITGTTNINTTGTGITLIGNSNGGGVVVDSGSNELTLQSEDNVLVQSTNDSSITSTSGNINLTGTEIIVNGKLVINGETQLASVGMNDLTCTTLSVGSSNFTVDGSGNTIIAGTLSTYGDTTLGSQSNPSIQTNGGDPILGVIGTSTTTVQGKIINILDAGATGINIGTNGTTDTSINIGNKTTSTTISSDSIVIGNSTTTTMTLQTSGDISIKSGTGKLNIGTDAIAHKISLGNQTGTTSISMASGSGGVSINSDNNNVGNVNINNGLFNTGTVNISTSGGSFVNIGNTDSITKITGALRVFGDLLIDGSGVPNSITLGGTNTTGISIEAGDGAIGLVSNNNMTLVSNVDATECIKIHATQGTRATSINIVSDNGGITLSSNTQVSISPALNVNGNVYANNVIGDNISDTNLTDITNLQTKQQVLVIMVLMLQYRNQ